MRILVSSKNLADKLSEIDFEKEAVWSVALNDNELTIITATKSVKVLVHVVKFHAACRQDHRRWDWVYSLVKSVSEQPIVLEIFENVTNVIFQY